MLLVCEDRKLYGPSSVTGNTVVCETTVQGSNPQRDPHFDFIYDKL